MTNRWAIYYSYREAPEQVLTYRTYPTRKAARERLASIAVRCKAAGNTVDIHGPDSITHANRTAYDVRRIV